jgi:hypothetical protein
MATSSNVKEIEGDLFTMPEGTALIRESLATSTHLTIL